MARIQLRGGTAAQWTSANPVLASREVGIETDTGKMKFGDGATAWTGLAYFAGTGLAAVVEDTSPQLGGFLDTNGFQVQWSKGADVASAAALAILNDGNYFDVTGGITITSINTTGKVGTLIKLHFDAILILTHHATDLILPTGANITTQAGDEVEFLEYAAGDFRCTGYLRADGTALVGGGAATAVADTGTVINLGNPLGISSNMGTANTNVTFTTTGAVQGGWNQVKINTATEPTVTGATKEIGATWVTGTVMYMNVSYNGTEVTYFFSHYLVNTDNNDLVNDTTPQLGGELDTNGHSVGGTPQTATGDGTTTIDWKLGNTFNFQFGAFNETFTFTPPTKPGVFILKLVQDSVGSRTATWPASVKWTSGIAPTLTTTATTGTDIITFYYDGTSYFAVQSLNFS